MKTRIPLLISLIVLSLSLSRVHGQKETDITPKTIRINLTVGANNLTVKNKVYAAFVTELKRIPDLEIVDKGYVYGLEIVANQIPTPTGINVGYALSTITTNSIPCTDFLYNTKYRAVYHALTLTENARLRSDVHSLVADFNKRLDPMRGVKVTILN